ncbi:hypothetical protein PIB30_020749 [Stylosanthes scabra]|uniref:Uncharacterized protein n=1 Tax=Stylosanthes scabra TaxID=79078 RepID=A0ABU6Z684_9FABA|nr:hypothetical protein [Stylosanthes scabra]
MDRMCFRTGANQSNPSNLVKTDLTEPLGLDVGKPTTLQPPLVQRREALLFLEFLQKFNLRESNTLPLNTLPLDSQAPSPPRHMKYCGYRTHQSLFIKTTKVVDKPKRENPKDSTDDDNGDEEGCHTRSSTTKRHDHNLQTHTKLIDIYDQNLVNIFSH